MPRILALVVLLAAGGYLLREWRGPAAKPAPASEPEPLPAAAQAPLFSPREIETIRQSLRDEDPEVRRAAGRLLAGLHDPRAGKSSRLEALVRGLGDADKEARLASLEALGDIGDPSVATWVVALLRDSEPEVRAEALRTLGRFQDKRTEEFRALASKLKRDYDEAVRRAEERR